MTVIITKRTHFAALWACHDELEDVNKTFLRSVSMMTTKFFNNSSFSMNCDWIQYRVAAWLVLPKLMEHPATNPDNKGNISFTKWRSMWTRLTDYSYLAEYLPSLHVTMSHINLLPITTSPIDIFVCSILIPQIFMTDILNNQHSRQGLSEPNSNSNRSRSLAGFGRSLNTMMLTSDRLLKRSRRI